MRGAPVTRRELTQLGLLTAAALVLWQVFVAVQPAGTEVGDLQTVIDIRQTASLRPRSMRRRPRP